MSDSHNPCPDAIFLEAHSSAQEIVSVCARSVLRQVALFSLRQTIDWRATSTQSQARPVDLTYRHFQLAREHCYVVADAWCRKLKEKGLNETADDVMKLFECEGTSLFHSPIDQRYTTTHNPKTTAEADISEAQLELTTLARVRHTARKCTALQVSSSASTSGSPLLAASSQLDRLGTRAQLAWEYPWRFVQNQVREIPKRLYNTRQEISDIGLVPRSLWEQQEQHQQKQYEPAEKLRTVLFKRRRRNKTLLPPVAKRLKDTSVFEEEQPRSASLQPERISLPSLDESSEQAELIQQYIHNEITVLDSETFPNILLGPLVVVGSTHLAHQVIVDGLDMTKWSVKKTQRARHTAKAERLGSHSELRDTDQRSKVRRTKGENATHWLDCDVRCAFLELGPANDRRLYWFDSIEASLLDENTDEDSTNYDGNESGVSGDADDGEDIDADAICSEEAISV